MNAERLLKHFEAISEADDAVQRLRWFVLELAIRGKLVEQNGADVPASALMERIAQLKARLAKEGSLKAEKELPPIEDFPFEIPNGWIWERLGNTGRIFNGNSVSESEKRALAKVKDGYPFIATKDVGYGRDVLVYDNGLRVPRKAAKYKIAHAKAVLICSEGGSAGKKIGLTDRDICFGNKLYANEVWQGIASRYIFYVYQSPSFFSEFSSRMTGIIGGIARSEFLLLPVPIPPEKEQERIVAKVDELMALCDELEAARTKRETRRDRLVAATLHRLNNGDTSPEAGNGTDFKQTARFYFNHLPRLTTRSEHTKELRQTIIKLAVSGKLVPQDPKDEPAATLLSRIGKQRTKLLERGYPNKSEASGQWRKQHNQSLPEGLRSLPHGWQWATLMQCATLIVDCHNKTAPYTKSGITILRTTNIRDGKLNLNEQKFVNEKTYERWSARCRPEPGDILITREAPMGEVCIIPSGMKVCMGQRMMLARFMSDAIDVNFMLYSLRDPNLMDRVQDKPVGATVQHLRVGGVETLLVPLPPLAEQYRIVAKTNELLALCDELEAQLTSTATTRRQLLEATLHDALGGHQMTS